jgi:hypothetical protein
MPDETLRTDTAHRNALTDHVNRPRCDGEIDTMSKRAYKTNLICFSRLSMLSPADTDVKFCMEKIVFSPNRRKAFIHAAFVSGPGHHDLRSFCAAMHHPIKSLWHT